jgi:hypothetical protein
MTSSSFRTREKVAIGLVVIWSSLAAYQIAAAGIRHDYLAYVQQWSYTLAGGNPWNTSDIPFNAYGPLHAFLAYFAFPSLLIPKFLFGLAIILLNLLFVFRLMGKHADFKTRDWVLYALIVPLNFLVFGAVFLFGNNDALVAAFLGFAVLSRLRGHFATAGVLIGLAVLLKFYPLLLLPALALDGKRLEWRMIVGAGVTIAVGFAITVLRWGSSFLSAVTGGAARESSILSILNFLQDMGLSDSLYQFLINWNTVAVVATVVALFVFFWHFEVDWITAAALTMLAVSGVYKVGHQQFLLAWLVLVAGLLVSGYPQRRFIVYASMPLVLGISLYQFLFVRQWIAGTFWDQEGYLLRVSASLPFFLLVVLTIGVSLIYLVQQTRVQSETAGSNGFRRTPVPDSTN